jgi:hypothetical protein
MSNATKKSKKSKQEKKVDPWDHADRMSIDNLRKMVDGGDSQIFDLGPILLSLGNGNFTYRGYGFRVQSKTFGECVVLIGGQNCRYWGTTKGRLEIAHGTPDTSRYDPAPGLMAPWNQVALFVPITNGWDPNQLDYIKTKLIPIVSK